MRSKFAASANMIQICFMKIISGIKKRRILCWFQIRWNGLKNGPGKKGVSNFFRDIFWTQINEFWIRRKFRIFWCPIINLMGNFCVAILALFANFESICLKNGTFSNILQTFKTYYFVNSFHFPFESFPFEIQKE